MSGGGPTEYRVSYSEWVRDRLLELAAEARRRGDGPQFVAAVREFHRRLCVYPQFGDPLSDLRGHPGHVRLGVVPPLAIRYAVLEEQRLVFVAAPPVLLHKSDTASG
jgi:hypothetical protein